MKENMLKNNQKYEKNKYGSFWKYEEKNEFEKYI